MPTFTASDLERLAHAIRAVARLAHGKDRIGADRYSGVRDTLVRAVAAGLTRASGTTGASDE